jgi:hypothetical protein
MHRSAGWTRGQRCEPRFAAGGKVLGPDERISAREALRLFLGHPDRPSVPRTVEVGQPGDLIVLTPGADVEALASDMVATTVIGGRVS